jgi:hypothetical protein
MKKQFILSLLFVIGLSFSAFAKPEERLGFIQGNWEPNLGSTQTYSVPYNSFRTYVWYMDFGMNESTTPILASGNTATITFTQWGVYELYCFVYSSATNEYIGYYACEPLVHY